MKHNRFCFQNYSTKTEILANWHAINATEQHCVKRSKRFEISAMAWHQPITFYEERLIVQVYYPWRGTAWVLIEFYFSCTLTTTPTMQDGGSDFCFFFTRVFGKPKEFPKVQLHGVSFMTLLCRRHRWLEGGNFLGNLVQSLIITSRNNCLGCAAGLSNLTLCITWSSIWAFLHKLILFLTCYVASSLHHRQHRTLYISIAVDL